MTHPKGYIFSYKGIQYENYSGIGRVFGYSCGLVQYWLNKTKQDDHFYIKDTRIEIVQHGTFEKQKPKPKYFNKNMTVENKIRISGNLRLTYSGISGKLIKTESI